MAPHLSGCDKVLRQSQLEKWDYWKRGEDQFLLPFRNYLLCFYYI